MRVFVVEAVMPITYFYSYILLTCSLLISSPERSKNKKLRVVNFVKSIARVHYYWWYGYPQTLRLEIVLKACLGDCVKGFFTYNTTPARGNGILVSIQRLLIYSIFISVVLKLLKQMCFGELVINVELLLLDFLR